MTPRLAARLVLPVSERDHLRGPDSAPVTLLEYGDYECPYCGQAFVILHELEGLAGGVMRCAFRNFPLTSVHPHAQHAAEAAEAAGGQGRFWDMHDTLYENQQALDDEDLWRYAAELELDMDRFTRDMTERRYAPRVREDFVSGVRSGVNGTPTLFINDVRYGGSYDLDSLLAAVEAAAEQRTG
jgi:protein-disulfide isomerase